jgi:hypothetical protein
LALSAEARPWLRDGQTPRQFLDQLVEQKLNVDAIRFLAHVLPKREAVWWASLCVRSVAGPNPPSEVTAALQAAEQWVMEPKEENRRKALAAAEAAGLGTPAGCTAVSAFWSGGSLGPANLPAIPPGEHLTARGVSGAVLLATVLAEPEKAAEKASRFLAQGIGVADGSNRWS